MNKFSDTEKDFSRQHQLVRRAYKELPGPMIALALQTAQAHNALSLTEYAKKLLSTWTEERKVPEELVLFQRSDQWRARRQFCLWVRRLKDHNHVCEYCSLDFPRHGVKRDNLPSPAQIALAGLADTDP